MKGKTLHRSALILIVVVLCFLFSLAAFTGDNCEERQKMQCRANMNTLASDLVLYHSLNGDWADDQSILDECAHRPFPLECPACGETYCIEIGEWGYRISCPCGLHGYVEMGKVSWIESE